MSQPQQPESVPLYGQAPEPQPAVYMPQSAPMVPMPYAPPPQAIRGPNYPGRLKAVWAVLIGIAVIFLVIKFFDEFGDGGWILLVVVGVPLAITILVVRALIRVGDKRPPPMVIAAPMMPTQVGPPAGWYADPSGVSRWFDGTRWTEFTQPT